MRIFLNREGARGAGPARRVGRQADDAFSKEESE